MDPEERELQVRLAELQADVQISLTAAFGFLAGFLAIVLVYLQIYRTLQLQDLDRIGYLLGLVMSGVALVVSFAIFAARAQKARTQIGKLRVSPRKHSRKEREEHLVKNP